MDSVDVDGLRIAFTKAGRGRPVVLLGGFVGDGFVTWRRQIEALSTSYTVVAWDPPGSGASSNVPESFRLPDYADCLAGLVSALMLEQPVIVGLSFGGALALEFFRRHGAQVRALRTTTPSVTSKHQPRAVPLRFLGRVSHIRWRRTVAHHLTDHKSINCTHLSNLALDDQGPGSARPAGACPRSA